MQRLYGVDMADWEDTILSNRHVHNQVGRHGRANGKSGSTFDVRRAFGTYEVKCPAAAKLAASEAANVPPAKLEIYTMNDSGNALIAELILPHVLHATVLLAASQKTMTTVVRGLEADTERQIEEVEPERSGFPRSSDLADSGEGDDEPNMQPDEDPVERRVREFEKNSFRSPKFWLRWQGQLLQSSTDHLAVDLVTNSGYVIFSGNDCGKFQGTFNCEQLDWDNVKISGWKTASRSARDFAVAWHKK